MMKMNKKSKSGIKRKIAFFSVLALFLNMAMAGMFAPSKNVLRAENDQMCEAAVDVVLIIDRSGSMNWEDPTRLSQAKIAANSFLDPTTNLGVNDQSALVSYATEATLDKELSNVHTATQAAVNSLEASGGTNIGDAIYLSNAELGSVRVNPQAVKVAILLTDGRATCPYPIDNCGFAEDQEDIDHAINAANAAATLGYKVFTIGLGATTGTKSINEAMLQDIAAITGASYYHAPDSADLTVIYENISQQLCQYGSISGCKYNDSNNDGDILGELTLPDWEINLSGDDNSTQLTDENGCYSFAGLEPGTYTINETIPVNSDWVQTYAPDPDTFTISWEDSIENVDFGNYLPGCGNDVLDDGEECDDGNNTDGDGCSAICETETDDPTGSITICKQEDLNGNGILNEGEPVVIIPLWTFYVGSDEYQAGENGCVIVEELSYGEYNVTEQLIGGWEQTGSSGNGTLEEDGSITVIVGESNPVPIIYFLNQREEQGPFCGDNEINQETEQCDDGNNDDGDGCSATCETETDDPYCGDEIVNNDEECDDGPNGSETCTSECVLIVNDPYCGDGNIDDGEQCDDGNTTSGDGCSASCATEGGGGGGGLIPSIRITKTPSVYSIDAPGGQVAYSYLVFNGGQYTISDINITDDKCSPLAYIDGDENKNDKLEVGEVWEYTCSMDISQTTVNVATVTGKTAAGNVQSTATATVSVVIPDVAIKIIKTASPDNFPAGGGETTYLYDVTNPGKYALSNVIVTDADCDNPVYKSGDTNGNNKLDNDEQWMYECSAHISETIITSGTAKGEVDGKFATDADPVTVLVGKVLGASTSSVIPEEMPDTGRYDSGANNMKSINIIAILSIVFILYSLSLRKREYQLRDKK